MAAVESNYGFPSFPAKPREGIGNVFIKVEFKCPPTAAIGRSKFEQGGKREVVVNVGFPVKPWVGRVVWGRIFCFFRKNCL